jgi:hypothetical protein
LFCTSKLALCLGIEHESMTSRFCGAADRGWPRKKRQAKKRQGSVSLATIGHRQRCGGCVLALLLFIVVRAAEVWRVDWESAPRAHHLLCIAGGTGFMWQDHSSKRDLLLRASSFVALVSKGWCPYCSTLSSPLGFFEASSSTMHDYDLQPPDWKTTWLSRVDPLLV